MRKALDSLLSACFICVAAVGAGCIHSHHFLAEPRFISKQIIPQAKTRDLSSSVLSSPRYLTIGDAVLAMESCLGATDDDRRIFENILQKGKSRIVPKERYSLDEARTVFQTIHEIITEEGYTCQDQDLLFQGLRMKKIDCDMRSLIYLSMGDMLKLPIRGVTMPYHMFVRFKCDDGSSVNWETTRGISLNDEYYLKELSQQINQGRVKNKLSPLAPEQWVLKEYTSEEMIHERTERTISESFKQNPVEGVMRESDGLMMRIPGHAFHNRARPLYEIC